ncbi:hypothetical protein BdWA1_001122 [Babesia duncani]|uniref:Uncharacterized protein n=1 Tax=Babesia duncani TaxID=323732 RepID=A0AAD9UQQ6_9APIC|nr:hypothetical protein BdWA1_001122 [Babesia duncani]
MNCSNLHYFSRHSFDDDAKTSNKFNVQLVESLLKQFKCIKNATIIHDFTDGIHVNDIFEDLKRTEGGCFRLNNVRLHTFCHVDFVRDWVLGKKVSIVSVNDVSESNPFIFTINENEGLSLRMPYEDITSLGLCNVSYSNKHNDGSITVNVKLNDWSYLGNERMNTKFYTRTINRLSTLPPAPVMIFIPQRNGIAAHLADILKNIHEIEDVDAVASPLLLKQCINIVHHEDLETQFVTSERPRNGLFFFKREEEIQEENTELSAKTCIGNKKRKIMNSSAPFPSLNANYDYFLKHQELFKKVFHALNKPKNKRGLQINELIHEISLKAPLEHLNTKCSSQDKWLYHLLDFIDEVSFKSINVNSIMEGKKQESFIVNRITGEIIPSHYCLSVFTNYSNLLSKGLDFVIISIAGYTIDQWECKTVNYLHIVSRKFSNSNKTQMLIIKSF